MSRENSLEIAVSYYILNRASFSGCGGFSKEASEKRLTETAIRRLKECNVNDILFSNLDCIDFLSQNPESPDTIVYADPPYYIENYIYGDLHKSFDHLRFANIIQQRSDWIISYNDCEYIRNLYTNCQIFQVNWSYSMNHSKKSNEIIILPA